MRLGAGLLAAMVALTAAKAASADEAVRVVIAGPKKDPIAARLEKELVALGFAPVAVGAVECRDANIVTAVQNAGASAALCSNNGRVAVWTDDGHELKLRDTVMAKDAHAAETIAMQAAEVMRANIAFREPEPVPPVPAPRPPEPAPTGGWDELENEDRAAPVRNETPRRAPLFTLSAGASYLMGQAASLGGLSLGASARVLPIGSITLHVDAPLSAARAEPMSTVSPSDGSKVRVAPGLAGIGFEVPFAPPSSFVIPRLGASLGIAWLRATKTSGLLRDQFGSFVSTTAESGDSIVAPAAFLSSGFSFRVAGPMRLVADGLIGATSGSIAIRNQGVLISRWGLPFGSVGLRAELLLP